MGISPYAQQGSQQTGLPPAFVEALIQAEGTLPGGSNNPFDVTNVWANLTGFGNWILARLWNVLGKQPNGAPFGVAIFTDANQAVASWAKGINSFPAYATFRLLAANPNTTPDQLAAELQRVGYAGNSTTYVSLVDRLYQQISGKPATVPIGNATTTPTPATSPIPAKTFPTPAGQPPTTGPVIPAKTFPAPTAPANCFTDAFSAPNFVMPDPPSSAFDIAGIASYPVKAALAVAMGVLKLGECLFWIVFGLVLVIVGLFFALRQQ